MKTKLTFCLAVISIWTANSNAQLFDDFNDGVINNSLWTTSLPFGHSSVSESGGRAAMVGRGGLGSVQSFGLNLEIAGRFRFTGQEDHFTVSIRSDLGNTPTFAEKFGIGVKFSDNGQSVRLIEYSYTDIVDLVPGVTFTFLGQTDYDFRITDDGLNVRLFMNNSATPILEGLSTFRAGDKVALYNREFTITRTELDFINIVPEPSSLALLGLGALCFLRHRKHRFCSLKFQSHSE